MTLTKKTMTLPNLNNHTILITRPQPEADTTAQQVREWHGIPLLAPALTIKPPTNPKPMKQAMQRLMDYDGILITSANGARAFIAAMPPHQTPPPLFAVGKKTASILQKQGWPVSIPPTAAGGETLAHAVMARNQQKSRFLFPRAEQGREELCQILEQAGYQVDRVNAYRAEPMNTLSPETKAALASGIVDATLFFSGRTAQAFIAALEAHGKPEWLHKTVIAVISPVSAKTVHQLGYTATVIAARPNSEGLLTALHEFWCHKKK